MDESLDLGGLLAVFSWVPKLDLSRVCPVQCDIFDETANVAFDLPLIKLFRQERTAGSHNAAISGVNFDPTVPFDSDPNIRLDDLQAGFGIKHPCPRGERRESWLKDSGDWPSHAALSFHLRISANHRPTGRNLEWDPSVHSIGLLMNGRKQVCRLRETLYSELEEQRLAR
jgi:hypothetical protein